VPQSGARNILMREMVNVTEGNSFQPHDPCILNTNVTL